MAEVIKIKNGDMICDFIIYTCRSCKNGFGENEPHYIKDNNVYCIDCAFKNDLITEREYLDLIGLCIEDAHAKLDDKNQIVKWIGSEIPPWERGEQSERNTKEYAEWRNTVFARDNYTCQKCKQVGGELNAHHIKPFAKYKRLRLKIDNGITLCKECHKKIHKER